MGFVITSRTVCLFCWFVVEFDRTEIGKDRNDIWFSFQIGSCSFLVLFFQSERDEREKKRRRAAAILDAVDVDGVIDKRKTKRTRLFGFDLASHACCV